MRLLAAMVSLALSSAAFAQPATQPGDEKTENLGTHSTEAPPPWAVGVSQDRKDAALKLFTEGNGYLNDGIFPKAVDTYHEALKYWDHPAIHFNMALALTKLDRPLEVEVSLQKAIAFGPAPLETQDKFEHAKEYLLLNAKQLAWIDVSCDKLGAKVSIDGRDAFVVEPGKPNRHEQRVVVGRHTIVAEKTGYNAQVDAPYIEPGQHFRIELKLYTSEELTRYRRRWSATWMPYAVLGAGVAIGGVGGLLQLSAKASYDDYDAEIARCNDSSASGCEITPRITDLKDAGDRKRTLGYVGYGVAGAALAAGAVLLYLNREVSYEITADEYKKEMRAKGKMAVVPLVEPGLAGATVLGRF